MSKAFRIYIWVVVGFTVLLIWWGAAVTTENVGMAVPGWPLMFGEINPDGWWRVWAYLLEHGHRLIASFVGTLTLVLFGILMIRRWQAALELLVVVVVLGVTMKFVHDQAYVPMFVGVGLTTAWLIWSWKKRDWTLSTKLGGLALLLVSFQAMLGGLRVLEISDKLAAIHGCVAQLFFCLLVLIALVVSPNWAQQPKLTTARPLRWMSGALFIAVFLQLVIGATLRHSHRFGLADDGILTTGGVWFPGFANFDFFILFLHKWWAVVVFVIAIVLAIWAWSKLRADRVARRLAIANGWLLVLQLLLGVNVIVTGKSFWITNFHVLNGLAILTLSFVLFVKAMRTIPVADESEVATVG